MGMRNKERVPPLASAESTARSSRLSTVELFCGIGGFRLAADRNGLVTTWANDACPKACAVYRDRFSATELNQGDIRDLLPEVPHHDVLTAGFPCQPFSSAGNKRGVRDPRGTLFQSVIDAVRLHRPRTFVLENVKRLLSMERGSHFATILSALVALDYLVEWRLLNSADFGLPQNRQRVFIVGTRIVSSRDPARVLLAPSEDLASLSPVELTSMDDVRSWRPIEKHAEKFPEWGLAVGGRFLSANLARFSDAVPVVPLRQLLQKDVPDEFDFTETTLGWIHENTPVNRFIQGVQILSNQGGGARMGYTIFGVDGLAPTLTSTASRHYERYKIGDRYRRLTNVEYARLQGFRDDHCSSVSVYDQYALFGNAVPPVMAAWVVRRSLEYGLLPNAVKADSPQLGLAL